MIAMVLTPMDIEVGKKRIAIPYINLIIIITLIVGALMAMFSWGGKFYLAADKISRIEATTNQKFEDIEQQIKDIKEKMKTEHDRNLRMEMMLKHLVEEKDKESKKGPKK